MRRWIAAGAIARAVDHTFRVTTRSTGRRQTARGRGIAVGMCGPAQRMQHVEIFDMCGCRPVVAPQEAGAEPSSSQWGLR